MVDAAVAVVMIVEEQFRVSYWPAAIASNIVVRTNGKTVLMSGGVVKFSELAPPVLLQDGQVFQQGRSQKAAQRGVLAQPLQSRLVGPERLKALGPQGAAE